MCIRDSLNSLSDKSYSSINSSSSFLSPKIVSSKNWTDVDGLISGLLIVANDNVLKELTALGDPWSVLVLIKNSSPNWVWKVESVTAPIRVTGLVICSVIVFTPSLIPNTLPLLSIVCLWSVESSVLFRPIDPSLNVEYRNTSGYAVSSDPSLFRGTLPKTLVILYVGRPLLFKFTLWAARLALATLHPYLWKAWHWKTSEWDLSDANASCS